MALKPVQANDATASITQSPPTDQHPRPIRSYVLRTGRFTQGQQRAIFDHWRRYGIDYTGQPRSLATLFGRQAPVVFEIGFGNGEALIAAASQDSQRNYVGVEVHRPGVGRLIHALSAAAMNNVRIYQHDVVEVLKHEIDDGALAEVRLFFPDPWPKKRHSKRRLIQPAFAQLLVRKLAIGGHLCLATDWQDYVEQMWDVLDTTHGLVNCAGPRGAIPRPSSRSLTHFERRGVRRGHAIWDLCYQRCIQYAETG